MRQADKAKKVMWQADQARKGLVNDPSKTRSLTNFCRILRISQSNFVSGYVHVTVSIFCHKVVSLSQLFFKAKKVVKYSICLLCLCNLNKWCQNALEPECLELILNTLKSWSGNWSSQNTLGLQRKKC